MKPTIKGTVTFTQETRPDDEGKSRFVTDWVDAYGQKKGQYYNANIEHHIRMWEEGGWTVERLDKT